MANNIKIVGNILDTTIISRYDDVDINLIPSKKLIEDFGGEGDYIEYYVYDIAGNLLNTNYNYLNYKLPTSTGLTPGISSPPNITGNIQTENVGVVSTLSTPTSSLYPIIEIDPIKDLQDNGYSSGEFEVRYNLFQNIISTYIDRELFIKEISQDRTELRLGSITLTNEEIESTVTSLINKIDTSDYYVDYLLNFGNNNQITAVNIALNKASEGYEILFKLYKPLPLEIQEKTTLWVVEEKVNPYVFDINLDKLIIPPPVPTLRGPNFDNIPSNQGTISTTYTDYSTSLLNLQLLQSSSYSQILNLMNTQSIQINVDYTDFNNFIFFSSATQRVTNFYNKVQQIEDYRNLINLYTPYVTTTASLQTEINTYSSSINTLISQFDGYESYLYFESSSYSWPKSGLIKPYSLLSTGSATVMSWYDNLTGSALTYDETNYDNLEYAVPAFIRDDENNSQYLTFLNMVGHYFDNIWIYLKAITDINLANNNLNKGISKDLVYNQLQSLGIKLYNSQAGESLDQFLIGANSGSNVWNDDFSITGSYLNNIPRKDLLSELYKRIYHNLPLLLKTKGTKAGLENLITTFGIPNKTYYTVDSSSFYTPTGSSATSSILNVKEFGGSLKSGLIKGYNNEKVRIVSNTITGSVLSPILSLQTFPTASAQFRENDMHYVDISFSPQTQIDTYISGAIASNNPTWSLDDYIGDPRQQYSTTYPDLDAQRQLYFETGVSGYAPFTGSLLNYNDFIRLIEYFDNALFKMLGDFVPERTSLSTGVTINSPVLERNKVAYANPTNTTTESVYTAQYSVASISSSYGTFYNALSSSNNTMGWFDGELSGSIVDVNQYFEDNYNPYLIGNVPTSSVYPQFSYLCDTYRIVVKNAGVTASFTACDGSTITLELNVGTDMRICAARPLNIESEGGGTLTYTKVSSCGPYTGSSVTSFSNSDWNTLLNNVSQSVISQYRNNIEYLGNLLPSNSIQYPAELQDSYLTLTSYNTSRYEGSKVISLKYNTYTSSSYTGSNGLTIQSEDKSYGKTAAIDQYVRKIGLFTSLNSDIFLSNKTNGILKYLVDESGSLTELNKKNKHWEEVQNTFKSGDNQVISLFDNQKFNNQKRSDGTKLTFNSGYSYSPIFYFSNTDKTASFQYFGESQTNMFKYETNGGTLGSGSSFVYQLDNTSDGIIKNIFGSSDDVIYNNNNIYVPGYDSTKGTFGYYDVTETGYYGFSLNNLKITHTSPVSAPGTYPSYYFFTTSSYGLETHFTASYSPKNIANLSGVISPKQYLSGSRVYFGIGRAEILASGFTQSINDGAIFQSTLSGGTPYASAPFTSSISTTQFCLDEQFALFYGYLFLPQGEGTNPSSSLYSTYGDVDYNFTIYPGDYIKFILNSVSYEYEISSVDVTQGATGSLCINVNGIISSALIGSIQNVSQVLILRKLKDETNIIFSYIKPIGQTSYGFLIPENLSPDVLTNIDSITSQVKQRLISDQGNVIGDLTGGTF